MTTDRAIRRQGRTGAARQRVRATWHWVSLLVGRHATLAAGAVLGGLSLAALHFEILAAPVIAGVLVAVGLVPLAVDLWRARGDLRRLSPLDRPLDDPDVPAGWEVETFDKGRIVRSATLDRTRPWRVPAKKLDRDFRVPDDLDALRAAYVYRVRRGANGPLTNDACVRLVGDPSRLPETLDWQPARYFDLLLTNYLAGRTLHDEQTGRTTADIAHRVISPVTGRLVPLEESGLANTVGVSTMLVAGDGGSFLVVQGDAAISSPGLLAPTASGGLEPADLVDAASFGEALRTGMERELLEELGLTATPPPSLRTVVLGYGRWIEKGGKPEFFGLSRVDEPLDEIARRVDPSEKPYIRGHLPVEASEMRRLVEGTLRAQDIPERGATASVPLEACLARLRDVSRTPQAAELLAPLF